MSMLWTVPPSKYVALQFFFFFLSENTRKSKGELEILLFYWQSSMNYPLAGILGKVEEYEQIYLGQGNH